MAVTQFHQVLPLCLTAFPFQGRAIANFAFFAFTVQLDANLPAFLSLISYCLPSVSLASFILDSCFRLIFFYVLFSYLLVCHCCCLWCSGWPYRGLYLRELAFLAAQKPLKRQTKRGIIWNKWIIWTSYDHIVLLLGFNPSPQYETMCNFLCLQPTHCTVLHCRCSMHLCCWKWPGTKMD